MEGHRVHLHHLSGNPVHLRLQITAKLVGLRVVAHLHAVLLNHIVASELVNDTICTHHEVALSQPPMLVICVSRAFIRVASTPCISLLSNHLPPSFPLSLGSTASTHPRLIVTRGFFFPGLWYQ